MSCENHPFRPHYSCLLRGQLAQGSSCEDLMLSAQHTLGAQGFALPFSLFLTGNEFLGKKGGATTSGQVPSNVKTVQLNPAQRLTPQPASSLSSVVPRLSARGRKGAGSLSGCFPLRVPSPVPIGGGAGFGASRLLPFLGGGSCMYSS